MALVNGGFLHYMDMKKFLKNFFLGIHVCIVQKNLVLRKQWSDFEKISQESGFDNSRRPDCPIRAVIATVKLT